MADVLRKSLSQLSAGISTGSLRAEELLNAAVLNHQRSGGSLGAYIVWDPDRGLEQARVADASQANGTPAGSLRGLPISVKDLFGVANYPTYAGTRKPLPVEWCTEGPVVHQLRRQQAVIAGKTHSVEFAFGGLGVNPHWRTPRNPWDPEHHRVPGGSSSGAGVSLCAGSAVLALGTDTAGSVRIPASMTGNVGLKTSIGRWNTTGIVPLSPSLDSVGLLTRTVDDAIFAFLALDRELAKDRRCEPVSDAELYGLRIGLSDGVLWSDCSPGVTESITIAVDELVGAGARKIALELPEIEKVLPVFRKGGLAGVELQTFLKNSLPDWIPLLDPKIEQRMQDAATLTACEYLERVSLFRTLGLGIRQRLRSVDILVSPAVPLTAPTMVEIDDLGRYRECNLLSLRNTSFVNCLGLCAVTLPVGLDAAGIPVGMQLVASHGQDVRLLSIARTVERCLGDSRERCGEPPVRCHPVAGAG